MSKPIIQHARIRPAEAIDAEQIAAIYDPVVRDSAISFELEPPTPAEIQRRIATVFSSGLPWLVCAWEGTVFGYAYASRHRARPAYGWSVDTSVYVAESARKRGVGTSLYSALLAILSIQRFQNAYAGITLPNPGSEALHRALGFVQIGTYARVGFKLGEWRDVVWYGRTLGEYNAPPLPLIPVSELIGSEVWDSVLGSAVERIKTIGS
jgi:L-amino acid N-acyltransferase YncA